MDDPMLFNVEPAERVIVPVVGWPIYQKPPEPEET